MIYQKYVVKKTTGQIFSKTIQKKVNSNTKYLPTGSFIEKNILKIPNLLLIQNFTIDINFISKARLQNSKVSLLYFSAKLILETLLTKLTGFLDTNLFGHRGNFSSD